VAESHSDEYVHGTMNAATQVADFRAFASLTKWASLVIASMVLFLTLWFCTNAGFLSALVAAIVVLAIGISVLHNRRRPVH
jgi:hypothetical protein